MTTTISILSQIALDAREFADAAQTEGFDAADALDQILDIAKLAEKKLEGIPLDAPIAVVTILGCETMCDDVLDMIELCIDHVLRHRDGAIAVKAKLDAFIAVYGAPDTEQTAHACSSAEGDAWDRAVELSRLIGGRYPSDQAKEDRSLNTFLFDEGMSTKNKDALSATLAKVREANETPFFIRPDQMIVSAGNIEVQDVRTAATDERIPVVRVSCMTTDDILTSLTDRARARIMDLEIDAIRLIPVVDDHDAKLMHPMMRAVLEIVYREEEDDHYKVSIAFERPSGSEGAIIDLADD
jgi:hypothetical protein